MERLRLSGYIRRPTAEKIRQIAAMEYMNPTEEEAQEMASLIDDSLRLIDSLDDLPQPELEVKHKERDKGYRPSPEEDPYNMFVRKCLVKGASNGKLAGKRVGIKDNMCLAGIPTTFGSRLSLGLVPDIDATVVERLLDAGAVIIGKLNMDDMAFSGTAETSAYGCIRNPRNPAFSAGGSSGGSGAAVASGDVDISLGVDEAGSGRIPAAWCGVISMKATHGLIPTFGMAYMDHTLDSICPTARTAEEVALTLEAIAGDDPKDPQWVRGPISVDEYSKAIKNDISGVRIGVIKESLDWEDAEKDVTDAFWSAIKKMEDLGATWQEVSLPFWKYGWAIWTGFAYHSISAMFESDLEGYWRGGLCNARLQEAFGYSRRSNSDAFPPHLQLIMVLGKYLRREYCNTYFSKAQNLRFAFAQEMDRLLETVDVLATPTTPMKAFRLRTGSEALRETALRSGSMTHNVCPFNVTGHPAITVPSGVGENSLPTAIQFAGKRWDESLLLRVAYNLEQSG